MFSHLFVQQKQGKSPVIPGGEFVQTVDFSGDDWSLRHYSLQLFEQALKFFV